MKNNIDTCLVELYVFRRGVKHIEDIPVALDAQAIYISLRKKYGKIYNFEKDEAGACFYNQNKPDLGVLASNFRFLMPGESYQIVVSSKRRKK